MAQLKSNWKSFKVGPEGIEPSSSVYKTPALPLSYGPVGRLY